MRACARLAVTGVAGASGTARTRISRLRSDPPLVLRPTSPVGPEPLRRWDLRGPGTARVSLVAGAAGPVGGDQLRLDIDVHSGAALILRAVAATVVLPGPHGQPSHQEVAVRVTAGATLVWLPGPVIAAHGCDHRAVTHIHLEPGARLLVREELLLGRHGERPGSVHQRLRVRLGDRPLHDQGLRVGPEASGWDGPAVLGGRKAVGSLLVVDPDWATEGALRLPAAAAGADTARLPLDGPAMLVTALAPDALALRHRLDAGLARLEGSQPCPPAPSRHHPTLEAPPHPGTG